MKKNKNILPRNEFIKRVLRYSLFALLILVFSLGLGIIGYHYAADLTWLDSFYNASMILTGMGPVNEMVSSEAKLFSSFYALFSGVAFLSTVAIFFSPIAHRLMHLLHVDDMEEE